MRIIMTREEILAVLKSNLYALSPELETSEKGQTLLQITSIKDLGLDSLEIIEIISRSMKQLKIKVPRPELMQIKNFDELLNTFEKYANQKQAREMIES